MKLKFNASSFDKYLPMKNNSSYVSNPRPPPDLFRQQLKILESFFKYTSRACITNYKQVLDSDSHDKL